MAKTGDVVNSKHFTGTLAQWDQHVANGDWDNYVVYGIIHDGTEAKNVVARLIFGAADSQGGKYEYNVGDGAIYWDDTDCNSDYKE